VSQTTYKGASSDISLDDILKSVRELEELQRAMPRSITLERPYAPNFKMVFEGEQPDEKAQLVSGLDLAGQGGDKSVCVTALKTIHGFRIIDSGFLNEMKQIRFPRSKKKRIRKKWRKDSRNWKSVPLNEVFQLGKDTLIMHTEVRRRL